MVGQTYERRRITRRLFRPEQTGTVDFIRAPWPRTFFRTKKDGRITEADLETEGYVPWLYDHRSRSMLFLRIPDDVDLTRAAFVYHTMRLHATHMVRVPMDDFYRMAATKEGHGHDIVWLYNVGRCGSTLLSHAISDATPSTGLSETPFHLQAIRMGKRMDDDERIRCMRAMTHWYAHSYGPDSDDGAIVIKIPHPCTVIHPLIDASVPEARSMFMYRDARKVVASSHRVSGSIHGKSRWAFRIPGFHLFAAGVAGLLSLLFKGWFRDTDKALTGTSSARLVRKHGFVAALTLMWIVDVHMFMAMRRRKTVPAVRYEDITPDTFPEILEGLNLGTVNRAALQNVLGRDSQAGTALSRQRKGIPLDDKDYAIVQGILREHTRIGTPEAVLPGTLH